ncbi:MAG: polyphosphate kinase 1 [Deltaproteobacteria bacterium]|nr:polyphosphate kinase 1 [Deltaproteobacteria bacterium]
MSGEYIKLLFNRDLSWLSFNNRVLEEAADDTVPLLERLRFLTIVSSNLDEFFKVRFAELSKIFRKYPTKRLPDGYPVNRVIFQAREEVVRQKNRQAELFNVIMSKLKSEGIMIYYEPDIISDDIDKQVMAKLPKLNIVIRKLNEPIPELKSEAIYIYVRFVEEYAIVEFDTTDNRLIKVEDEKYRLSLVLIERWIISHIRQFFPQRDIIEAFPFKIIREHNISYEFDEESLDNFVEKGIKSKRIPRVVRLEVDSPVYPEGAIFIASALRIDSISIYRFSMPLNLKSFSIVLDYEGFDDLKYPKITPVIPTPFNKPGKILDLIQKHDVLLHHPYDSFDIVVNFIKEASTDPNVTDIFHVIYRAGEKSMLLEFLKQAANSGKNVYVYVEIKARFDEKTNLKWMKELKSAKVKVIPPLKDYKVHSKVTQIVMHRGQKTIYLTHLGTGNYHPTTTRLYTDLGLLTSNQDIGQEVHVYFNRLAQGKQLPYFKHLLVAPANLRTAILRLIRNEIINQIKYGNGLIIAKMNSLVDPDTINALYNASMSGVKIFLIVRGMCCLKPNIKGISENIRVSSIIDRFLEHSRIFYFHSNGEEKIYLSSADWMPRNFYKRYEIAFPIYDELLKRYVKDVILETALSDNVKARILQPDGSYVRIRPAQGEKLIRSQFQFVSLAESSYRGTILEKRIDF